MNIPKSLRIDVSQAAFYSLLLRAEDGATALHMAAQAGNLDCALALLGCGADPELAATDGTLPVHLACIASSQAAALLTLLLPATSPDILE